MEGFSLLKYWRGGGCETRAAPPPTTLVTAVAHNPSSSPSSFSASCDDSDEICDDGPFFDLEFEEDHNGFDLERHQIQELEQDEEDELLEEDEGDETNNHKYDDDGEVSRHFNFTLSTSSGSSNDNDNDNDNHNINVCSPSDDIFFKGRLVPIETTSSLVPSEPNTKPHQVPSLLRSATKFRVLTLGSLKKHPKGKTESKPESDTNTKPSTKNNNSKFLIVSLFTRDNSSKSSVNNSDDNAVGEAGGNNNDKKFSKEAMQRYLKKVNQVYVRVSKRNNGGNDENNDKSVKSNGNNLSLNLNMNLNFPVMVCKHLGKSRSASSSVVVAPPRGEAVVASRRDDSLFQQQDGIQSAILHCKRSFNASSDSEKSVLARSVSDPLQEKCVDLSRKSADGEKKVGDMVRKCGKVEQ